MVAFVVGFVVVLAVVGYGLWVMLEWLLLLLMKLTSLTKWLLVPGVAAGTDLVEYFVVDFVVDPVVTFGVSSVVTTGCVEVS